MLIMSQSEKTVVSLDEICKIIIRAKRSKGEIKEYYIAAMDHCGNSDGCVVATYKTEITAKLALQDFFHAYKYKQKTYRFPSANELMERYKGRRTKRWML